MKCCLATFSSANAIPDQKSSDKGTSQRRRISADSTANRAPDSKGLVGAWTICAKGSGAASALLTGALRPCCLCAMELQAYGDTTHGPGDGDATPLVIRPGAKRGA